MIELVAAVLLGIIGLLAFTVSVGELASRKTEGLTEEKWKALHDLRGELEASYTGRVIKVGEVMASQAGFDEKRLSDIYENEIQPSIEELSEEECRKKYGVSKTAVKREYASAKNIASKIIKVRSP